VLLTRNEVFETYLNIDTPSLSEGFLPGVHTMTTRQQEGRRKDFAESEIYHNLQYPDVYEIRHNDYRYNAGGPQKYAQDLLPKGRGSTR
jgi:hypothetical protein